MISQENFILDGIKVMDESQCNNILKIFCVAVNCAHVMHSNSSKGRQRWEISLDYCDLENQNKTHQNYYEEILKIKIKVL